MKQIKYFFYFLVVVVVVWLIVFLTDSQKQKNQNVIGYFHCKHNNKSNYTYSFVLKKSVNNDFSVLEYKPLLDNILNNGKPKNLDDLIEIETFNRKVKPKEFTWRLIYGGDRFVEYALYRVDGALYRYNYLDENNLDSISRFKCKYGEEGKKLFWEYSQEIYNKEKPKF